MTIASGAGMFPCTNIMEKRALALVVALAILSGTALAASNAPSKGEVAKADEQRKKPLQRCDELKDKAQLECLQKARERIVEARQKREAAGKQQPAAK